MYYCYCYYCMPLMDCVVYEIITNFVVIICTTSRLLVNYNRIHCIYDPILSIKAYKAVI
jgi:hypothetical protein